MTYKMTNGYGPAQNTKLQTNYTYLSYTQNALKT